MKNKKLMLAVAAITMCAASFTFVTACNQHTHTYDWTTTKTPNCTEKGEETGVCSDPECQDTATRPLEIIPGAHAYGEWRITKPTYEREGKAYKACANNSEHVVEFVLPKILSPEYEKTPGENGKYTFKIAHELGDISFELELEHTYNGELTLVAAPTFTSYGIAVKACTDHEDDNDKLEILIPMLSMKSADLTCEYTTPPTENKSGKGTYTFKYFDESVSFDAEVPATCEVEELFNGMFTGDDYKYAGEIGVVDVLNTSIVTTKGQQVFTNKYKYECGDGFTHVRNDGDYADYYYYEMDDPDDPVKIIKVDDAGGGLKRDPIWYSSGNPETDAAGLKGVNFINGDISAYGTENFARAIYNYAIENNYDLKFFTFNEIVKEVEDGDKEEPEGENPDTNAENGSKATMVEIGETSYAFSYQSFVTTNIVGFDDKGFTRWQINDLLTVNTVAFKLNDNGMVKSWDISFDTYSFTYYVSSEIPFDAQNQLPLPEAPDGYYKEALDADNPIRGYKDGNYYVYPGSKPGRTVKYTADIKTKEEAGEITSPYNIKALTSPEDFEFGIKCGGKNIQEGEVVEGDTRTLKSFEVCDLPEGTNLSLLDYNIYLVTGSGADEVETELHYYNGDLIKPTSDGTAFTLLSKRVLGDFHVRVKIGGASFDFIYRNSAGKPNAINAQLTAYDANSDKYLTKQGGALSVYEGETFYVGANAPDVDGRITDGSYKAYLMEGDKEIELTDLSENGVVCKFDTVGEYTILVKSLANEALSAQITVTVKPKPDMTDVFADTYALGNKSIEFKDNNKVTINDGRATVTYTYTYDESTMTATLSEPTGGTHNYEYSIIVTPAYGIALKFGDERELYFKGVKVEDLLAGTKWSLGNGYLVFKNNKEGVITTSLDKLNVNGNPDVLGFTEFKAEKLEKDSYTLTFKGHMFNSYNSDVSWFDVDFDNFSVTVKTQGEAVVGITYNKKDFSKVLTPLEEAYQALTGNKWSYYGTYITFTENGKGFASYNKNSIGTSNDCLFTYTLTQSADGKFKFTFVQDGMCQTTVGGFDMYGAPECFVNQGSYVTVSDGKISEFWLNYYYESSGDAEMVEFDAVKTPAQLLSEKKWEYQGTFITFYEDGTGFASQQDKEVGTSNDCLFTYTLTGVSGGKYKLTFEHSGMSSSWAGGFDPASASNGSYIIVGDNEIKSFQFIYDPDADGGSPVELVKKEDASLTAVYETLAGVWSYDGVYITLKADGTGFASTTQSDTANGNTDVIFHYAIASAGEGTYTIEFFKQGQADDFSRDVAGWFECESASANAGFTFDGTTLSEFKVTHVSNNGETITLVELAKAATQAE